MRAGCPTDIQKTPHPSLFRACVRCAPGRLAMRSGCHPSIPLPSIHPPPVAVEGGQGVRGGRRGRGGETPLRAALHSRMHGRGVSRPSSSREAPGRIHVVRSPAARPSGIAHRSRSAPPLAFAPWPQPSPCPLLRSPPLGGSASTRPLRTMVRWRARCWSRRRGEAEASDGRELRSGPGRVASAALAVHCVSLSCPVSCAGLANS